MEKIKELTYYAVVLGGLWIGLLIVDKGESLIKINFNKEFWY